MVALRAAAGIKMKITKTHLKQMIKEELEAYLREASEEQVVRVRDILGPDAPYEWESTLVQLLDYVEDEEQIYALAAEIRRGLDTGEPVQRRQFAEQLRRAYSLIMEGGGNVGNFGGRAGALGTVAGRKGQELDKPDHSLMGPEQIAEDDLVGLLVSLGTVLDEWATQKYSSSKERAQSYFEDIQAIVEEFDPCAHPGESCDDAHPDQSHEECIEVSINDELYEDKKNDRVSKKISHLKSKEGMPQDQAVATALNMEKEGRLTKSGKYKKKGKK